LHINSDGIQIHFFDFLAVGENHSFDLSGKKNCLLDMQLTNDLFENSHEEVLKILIRLSSYSA